MRKIRFGVGLVIACVLAMGVSPGVMAATECDDDQILFTKYEPTVDPSLLNALLNLLGSVPVQFSFDVPFNILYDHTLHLTVNSSIPLGGVNFLVETEVGGITVTLGLPPWGTSLGVEVSHGASRNCGAEYSACTDVCDDEYNACCTYWGCDVICGPIWLYCESLCAGAWTLCEADNAARWAENGAIDLLLNENVAAIGWTGVTVEQWADVCVIRQGGHCLAIHPLVGTDVTIQNFGLILFPPGPIGDILNVLISGLVDWVLSLTDVLADFFEDDGKGVLINVFSNDIKNDGCEPVQAVRDCQSAACSVVDAPRSHPTRSASALLYFLPVAVMTGLILWRRRR